MIISLIALATLAQNVLEVDFDALDVEGKIVKPSVEFVTPRAEAKFAPNLPIRKDFNVEMRQSTDELK